MAEGLNRVMLLGNLGADPELRTACEEDESQEASAGAVSAAAAWMVGAADAIWGLCRRGRAFEGKRARGGKKFAEREWRGFSAERWGVWRSALREIGQGREDVDAALECMERAAGP